MKRVLLVLLLQGEGLIVDALSNNVFLVMTGTFHPKAVEHPASRLRKLALKQKSIAL